MKMPAQSKVDRYEESRARDHAALAVMAARGCTFSEAVLQVLEEEERQAEVRKAAPLFAARR